MKTKIKVIYLTAFIFFTFSICSYGQVYKLKSTTFSFKYKINDYRWSDWEDWEETTVLITIDLYKDRVTIYSKVTQVYDIAKNEGESYDNDGDRTLSYYCVDKDGMTCRISLVKLISQNGKNQLYVDYNDMKWVYNIYSLD